MTAAGAHELPPRAAVDRIVAAALAEDLGDVGDLTSLATVPADRHATGAVVARAAGTVAGLGLVARVLAHLDAEVVVAEHVADGATVPAGTVLATLDGSARTMLTAERTALNLLGHLSGIATATRALVDAVADLPARVVDTRKTTPGIRSLERYAVRCGGGHNHRYGLHDAVMIKDNHLVAAGSITAAVEAARRTVGHTVIVELEVDELAQLPEALAVGVDVVLLDNFTPGQLREAVALVDGAAVTEASGGITLDGVRAVAEAGVDIIAVGWITHSAPRLDVALDLSVG